MKESDAIQLIQKGIPTESANSTWVDLGSGSGTFTKALAKVLGNSSTILAIDKENHKIVSPNNQVKIQSLQSDFTKASLPDSLDGILMANSLHYVKDQLEFIKALTNQLKPTCRIIVVEYDTDQSNTWVPYPVTFNKMKELLLQSGYKSVIKIGEMDSVYNQNKIYACVALR